MLTFDELVTLHGVCLDAARLRTGDWFCLVWTGEFPRFYVVKGYTVFRGPPYSDEVSGSGLRAQETLELAQRIAVMMKAMDPQRAELYFSELLPPELELCGSVEHPALH